MKQTLLKNGYIISMNANREVFVHGDVLIEGNTIKAVGHVTKDSIHDDADVVDVTGKMVMPGLINTHVHLSQQLGRGIADDVDLLTWLRKRIWPYESSMTEEEAYISALACSIELIKSGVTTLAEAGGHHVDALGKAVKEVGLRAILSRSTMDMGEGLPLNWQETTNDALKKQEALIEKWHHTSDERIKMWFGLRTIFNCSDDLIRQTKQLADQYGVGIHMHAAEIMDEIRYTKEQRGASTIEHLHKLGLLDENLLTAHMVWLTDREMDLVMLHNVKVSHNPGAAMKVLGFARIPEMLEKGIDVSIGTDGAPANNRMDMMDEMYVTSLIHKGRTLDTTTVPAEQVLEMATVKAAKCLLRDREIGSLEQGKRADLIIIDPKQIGSFPMHDPIANIVYSMHASNVESSMCNGQWLMKDRNILTVNENEIIETAQQLAEGVVKRAGIHLKERFLHVR
ncbi:amidohydrolase [Virgibacillus dokdonensis]|uniref:Atrazine chlorohydrolase n=1 Tax=Virgibacillus dokdonensis TaxID=302167 RepID=A0A2K9J0V4_9BACI|nr:amidohydrolase [Virgibacillus dokdonensis]AUJ25536.1 Atrazine chlorohydrolase [Virgibacillus dokdonensis]